ncbi:MAG TPA: UDP-N-acetylmuramate:L-alanyl-gamma-D-glutamyl-meso-diaminopimelate ligase [Chromatiales bacterium]|nr:UDP-N-acetylmuramate:L-alanyl-gamma-D-glutamyl-meso-diaminopimelate ligase [Chromatiales bacterium]
MHVHILGICGTFMAGVAAIAREAGHRVTGSDQGIYPPMSDQLAALGIDLVQGYEPEQLDPAPDVVVVGNVMSRGMPVVEALLNSRIPYLSGPEWLAREILGSRRVVAVAGTHGKTTTTSLLAWMLEVAGQDPGFLIGGVASNFGISARLGSGDAFVIEADEYDTAFFDKRAKFLHYRPEIAIINNLEFDHADIYADLAAIQWQFHQLLRMLPGHGALLVRAGDANIAEVLKQGCWTPVETWSSDPDREADWTGLAEAGHYRLLQAGQPAGECGWQLTGSHNAENVTAALLAARHLGVDLVTGLEAVRTFAGVRRRLELLGSFGGVRLYDDFAHHPTAIERTLEGLRQHSRPGRLLVVFEPRSNTMRLGVHRDTLAGALSGADLCWVYRPAGLDWGLQETQTLQVRDSVEAIVADVVTQARPGDEIVVMSNGSFQGIHQKLEHALGPAD